MIVAARKIFLSERPDAPHTPCYASVVALGAAFEANASVGPVCEQALPAFSPLRPTPSGHREAKRDSMASNPATGHLRCARSCRTHARMIVRSIRHRGLRQLVENDSSRLLNQNLVERVRGIVTALAIAETMEGFVGEAAPGWRAHRLSGERRNE